MATSAEPATDALYQALSSPNPDPQVVHTAIEEIRYLSGQNVIVVKFHPFSRHTSSPAVRQFSRLEYRQRQRTDC